MQDKFILRFFFKPGKEDADKRPKGRSLVSFRPIFGKLAITMIAVESDPWNNRIYRKMKKNRQHLIEILGDHFVISVKTVNNIYG